MTRKDYVLIAEAVTEAKADILAKEPAAQWRDLCDGVREISRN